MKAHESFVTVAVWMVTYEHENFIEQAIESVMNQESNFDYRLFIGEDFSTDNTRYICKKMKKKYPDKIDLTLNNKNLGSTKNAFSIYSKCINSKAKYIALLEGDDFWIDPLKLQKQVDFLEASPSYSLCWTRFKTLEQNTQELTLDFNSKHFAKNENIIDFDFETSFKGWHMGTQTLVFKSLFFDLEALKKFKYFKDMHLVAHLLKKGKGACLNDICGVYRIHSGGIYSSQGVYDGYKKGYLCNREIYNDNKTEKFVKKKYFLAFQNFINSNIKHGYLLKAFWLSFDLFFEQRSIIDLLRNFKRILLKLLT